MKQEHIDKAEEITKKYVPDAITKYLENLQDIKKYNPGLYEDLRKYPIEDAMKILEMANVGY